MDNENVFWITIWKIVAACIIALVALASGCTVTERILISKAIEAGVDPNEARCAIVGVTQTYAAICGIIANGVKQ